MKSYYSSSSISLIFSFIFCVFLNNIPPSSSIDMYTSCSNQFSCGSITNIGFPFWGDARPESCGHPGLKLTCSGVDHVTTLQIMDVQYRVLEINQDAETIKIVRDDYVDKICSPKFGNTGFDSNLFELADMNSYLDVTLLYGCDAGDSVQAQVFSCPSGETYKDVSVVLPIPGISIGSMCNSSVLVRVSLTSSSTVSNISELQDAIAQGFEVKYKVDSAAECGECVGSKGVCGYERSSNNTVVCYCPNSQSQSGTYSCPATANGTLKLLEL